MQVICDDQFIALALDLAEKSRSIVKRYFRSDIETIDKADATPVTVADREAEAAMRSLITQTFPDHGIIGEEHGEEHVDREYVWVLDPIDGTRSFVAGLPLFGTLIALAHRGRSILGVIDHPATNERWLGAIGHTTTHNGVPASSRACPAIGQATLYATGPELFTGADAQAFTRLRRAVKLTRYSTDCYAYGMVAGGFGDLVAEAGLKSVDYMALTPIVEGAGGVITDWQGRSLSLASGGRILAAGDERTHAQALSLLAADA